jgi:hypothetical protein
MSQRGEESDREEGTDDQKRAIDPSNSHFFGEPLRLGRVTEREKKKKMKREKWMRMGRLPRTRKNREDRSH